MPRQAIPLGRIFGIPVGVDYSWFLIFFLLTWTLAVGYYPVEFKDWPATEDWLIGALTTILLFASVLLHELGHSLVVLRYKIPVRRITLFIFGGISQISGEPPSARAEFWIAMAGPLVSFALAVFFGLCQFVVTGSEPLLALASYLAYINGALALFNLIPGFPLDGGRIFRAIIWNMTGNPNRATVIAAGVGQFVSFLFICIGVWQMFAGQLINGLWIAFIGWFLESAALAQVQQQRVQGLLAGHTAVQAMSHSYTTIHAGTTVQELVDGHIFNNGQRGFVVEQEDKVVGLLTLPRLKTVPRAEWATTTVAQVMIPLAELTRIRPETPLWTALEAMGQDGINQLLVMTDGHFQGVLTQDDIGRFLWTLRELQH